MTIKETILNTKNNIQLIMDGALGVFSFGAYWTYINNNKIKEQNEQFYYNMEIIEKQNNKIKEKINENRKDIDEIKEKCSM